MHDIKESVFSLLGSFKIPARLLILLLVSCLFHTLLAVLFVYTARDQQNQQPTQHNVVMIQLGHAPAHTPAASAQQTQQPPSSQTLQQLPSSIPATTKESPQAIPPVSASVQQSSPLQSLQTQATHAIQTPPSASAGRESKTAVMQHEHAEKSTGDVVFGSTGAPTFSKQVTPVYPPLARRRGREGSVLLRLHISKTGQLTRTEVLEDPGYGFAEAALEAVHASQFVPGHLHGKAVSMKATLSIRFNLH